MYGERERLEDLNDRDAFAERMKDRDRERTIKLVEDRSSKASGAAAEAAQRRQLADDANARIVALPSLRLHSRQEYLTKRELKQTELLRKEIADDEALFSGMKISKRERRDLEHKKEVLKLVEARLKICDKYEGYQLPEDYITEQDVVLVPGRQFPVDIHYTPQPEANCLHAAITTVFQIHTTQPKGDILVFLTASSSIFSQCSWLTQLMDDLSTIGSRRN